MLAFLIDENLPRVVGGVFETLGFSAACVSDIPSLRQQSDEVIFRYAVEHTAIIVTRDIGFANPLRFPLHTSAGSSFFDSRTKYQCIRCAEKCRN